MTLISILAQKFSYIAAYISFFKDDYTHIIDKQEFKSITFLECLFQLKFFRYNGHSFLLLLKPLISSIGIIFRDPESPDTLIDVSTIVTLKCMELIREEVKTLANQKDPLSSVERYLISKFSIAALGYINFVIQQRPLSRKFKLLDHTENLLNDMLKSILQSLKFLFRNPSVQPSLLEDILSGLYTNFFDSRYLRLCGEISLNPTRIDALKYDHYQEFLTNSAAKDQNLPELPEIMKTTLNGQVATLNNIAQINIKKPYMQQRLINIFKRENNKDEAKAFPFLMSSSIYGNVTWVNYLKSLTSNISKTLNDSSEFMSSYAAAMNFELPTERSEFNLPSLYNIKSVPFLDIKKILLKIGMLSQQTDTRFYQAISQNLIQQAILQQDVGIQVNPNDIQGQQTSPIKVLKQLKYFGKNSCIKSEADLQNAETQVKTKIKILSERILVETIPLSVTTPAQQTVAEKVLGELSKMDDFERNLFLCHLGQYQIFASFEFPRNFTEIFEEFTWIHNNIKTYLEILQDLSPLIPQQPIIPHEDPLESLDELTFCKSYDLNISPTGQTAVPPLDPSLKKNLHQLHNLFSIDDNVVESLASSFYLVFSNETPAPLTGLLNELCNSAPFQTKLLDFCFFFLYSPGHISLLDQADMQLPCGTLCDLKSRSKLPLDQNYDKVTQNVLSFLVQHIKQRIYLVCQPKTYLEQYGLKSLQELKLKTNYKDVTKEFISLGDLLIGLLGIKEINSNTTLLQELQNLLKTVFTQKIQFKIWDSKQSADDTPFDEKKVLTVKSCKAILKMSPIDVILKNLDHIAIYDFEILLQHFTEKITVLQKPVDQINSLLKSTLNGGSEPVSISENDLKPLFDLTKSFESLEEIFTFICSIFLTWDSAEKEKSTQTQTLIKQQQDKVYIKALSHLASQVLTEPATEDFIIHIFELLNYLASPTLAPFKQVALILPTLMRSCIQFYALLCCKNKISEKQIQEPSEEIIPELPKFAQIVSCENVKERDALPGLEQSYSNLRRSREFDFDILITDMCKKHQNNIEKAFFVQNKKSDAINFLSQRVPWILDFTLKYKIFM